MSDKIEDRKEYQTNTKEFFERFAKQKGLDPEALQKPELRVRLIKELTSDQFLDLMSVANAKLRGEYKRWKRDYQGKDHRAVVTSGLLDSADLEPPVNSEQEFAKFYVEMQANINEENLQLWGTKLYTAIIFLHMFPDGNGRLARNAFSFLSTGEMADEQFTAERPSLIRDFCDTMNVISIQQMLEKNGCTRFNYKKIGGLHNTITYQADERLEVDENSENGLTSRLKFIAAKKAGIIKSRAKDGDEDGVSQCFANGKVLGFEGQANENGYGELYELDTNPWSQEEIEAFKKEYEATRSEWFEETIEVIDQNAEITQLWLELAMSIPNPFFIKVNTLLKILQALSKEDRETAKELLDKDKMAGFLEDEAKYSYLHELLGIIKQKPDISNRVSKLLSE